MDKHQLTLETDGLAPETADMNTLGQVSVQADARGVGSLVVPSTRPSSIFIGILPTAQASPLANLTANSSSTDEQKARARLASGLVHSWSGGGSPADAVPGRLTVSAFTAVFLPPDFVTGNYYGADYQATIRSVHSAEQTVVIAESPSHRRDVVYALITLNEGVDDEPRLKVDEFGVRSVVNVSTFRYDKVEIGVVVGTNGSWAVGTLPTPTSDQMLVVLAHVYLKSTDYAASTQAVPHYVIDEVAPILTPGGQPDVRPFSRACNLPRNTSGASAIPNLNFLPSTMVGSVERFWAFNTTDLVSGSNAELKPYELATDNVLDDSIDWRDRYFRIELWEVAVASSVGVAASLSETGFDYGTDWPKTVTDTAKRSLVSNSFQYSTGKAFLTPANGSYEPVIWVDQATGYLMCNSSGFGGPNVFADKAQFLYIWASGRGIRLFGQDEWPV